MTTGADPAGLSVSDAVARRIKEARGRRGWTAKQLAEQCAARGLPRLTHSVLNNIESGRHNAAGERKRDVTVDELVGLAMVLDVAPLHLLALPEGADKDTAVRLLPDVAVSDNQALVLWMRGEKALPANDARLYYSSTMERLPAVDSQRTTADFARSVLQDRAKEIVQGFNEQTAQLAASAAARMQSLITEAEQALGEGASPEEVMALLKQASES
ncbi:helix-turn-helix transcriptional regulator [Streptacidiphilus sp. N1-10]|uniref:Helix-turn-helix transcriptional regulator n=1 Tax=Streptacidiphilus jeojiensis TaxID=3229225 RepID=A0ABV6XXE5_9ACTN